MAQLWGQVSRQPGVRQVGASWQGVAGMGSAVSAAVTEPRERRKEAKAGGRKLGKVREVNAVTQQNAVSRVRLQPVQAAAGGERWTFRWKRHEGARSRIPGFSGGGTQARRVWPAPKSHS